MAFPRFGLALGVLATASLLGCNCNNAPPRQLDVCAGVSGNQADHPGACGSSGECSDHYTCSPVKGNEALQCCLFADRKCTTEADCCPGQTCPEGRKKCFDKFFSCTTDADCGEPGVRFCLPYVDSYVNVAKDGPSMRCQYKPCGNGGACPDGLACFQGECLAGLPCGGACEPGKACVPSVNRCQDYAQPAGREGAACPVSCAPGHLATFKDNTNLWDKCALPDVGCVCAELPSLTSEDLGRHSALAALGSELWVSTYDGQFGDLVVRSYDSAGKLTSQQYVDGVPEAAPKYGPSGARGGVAEPGDDVGRYTDVATHNGHVYVSYYDATRGDLRLATRTPSGAWSVVTVDGAQADLGLYTSIAVDSDGLPAIAYFQRAGGPSFDPSSCPGTAPAGEKASITALKLAKAKKPVPAAGDFSVATLACQARPLRCEGCTQTCADLGNGPACVAGATDCSACNAEKEVCVKDGATSRCAPKATPPQLLEISDGVGLFPSLAFDGKDAYLAFMRRTQGDGDLMGVRVSGSGVVGPLVTLDASGDTGHFPALQVDSSQHRLALSYHNASARELRFLSHTGFQAGLSPEVVDSGLGAPGSGEQSWVGADSALALGPNAEWWVVYQDATRGDLRVSRRQGGWEKLAPVHTEGAVGFFADLALVEGRLWVSHARIQAKLVGGQPRLANTLLLEPVAGP